MPVTAETLRQFPNSVFIETGSFRGDGTQAALDAGFEKVYTIEADEGLWVAVDNRFKNEPRVTCLYGLSTKHLLQIMATLSEPATFWLDAHTCTSTGAGSWACPLVEELRQIAVQPIKTHTILVDDLHLCGLELPGMGELRQRLFDINPDYKLSYASSAELSLGLDILVAQP